MAFSKCLQNNELDLKIHYTYYNNERCTVIPVEFSQLQSLGYVGMEAVIQSQIGYLGRMTSLRFEYRDEEGDYIDLFPRNFPRFLKFLRDQSDVGLYTTTVNLRVSEGSSPYCAEKKTERKLSPESKERSSRKELNFNEKEDFLQTFTYKSPLEYSLENLKDEMEQAEIEVESAKEHFDKITNLYCNADLNKGRGKQCSNCHLRLDHNMRQCKLEKCQTSQQCGDVSKHLDEKALVDSALDQLKKMERDLKSKTSEYETRVKCVSSSRTSFSQQVRGHLINSNKMKYLVKTGDGTYVPKSGLVNVDLAKLEKHFHGIIPQNLEETAKNFTKILESFEKKPTTDTNRNPARKKLQENVVFPIKFPAAAAGSQASMARPAVLHSSPVPISQSSMVIYNNAEPLQGSIFNQPVWYRQSAEVQQNMLQPTPLLQPLQIDNQYAIGPTAYIQPDTFPATPMPKRPRCKDTDTDE